MACDCMWCGYEDAVVAFEVFWTVRGDDPDRWFDVCGVCVPDCVADGERDPDVLDVRVEQLVPA